MSVAKGAGVVSLEPSSTDAQGIVYSIKLTDDEAQKLIDNDEALTLALDAANGGRLTIGEETMTLSLQNELKPNNFECYCRQGRRCAKVGNVCGSFTLKRQLSDSDLQRLQESFREADRKVKAKTLVVGDASKITPSNKRKRSINGTRPSLLNSLKPSNKRTTARAASPLSTPAPKRQRVSPPRSAPLSTPAHLSSQSARLPSAVKPRPSGKPQTRPLQRPSPAKTEPQRASVTRVEPQRSPPPKLELQRAPPLKSEPRRAPSVKPEPQRDSKVKLTSHPPRAASSPNLSRVASPSSDSTESQPKESTPKSMKELRTGIMHILALGNVSQTKLRERLPEYEYNEKAKVVNKVGKYNGQGYDLKEKYWDEIDPEWPEYTRDERDAVEEAKEKVFIESRCNLLKEKMPPPPAESKQVSEAFDRAWARWKERKDSSRPEITSDEMDDEYRSFYNKWLPHFQLILNQVGVLINYFEQYAKAYEALEYRFEYEAADKHIHEIALQWAERKEHADFLMPRMHKELTDVKSKVDAWAARNEEASEDSENR